MMGFFSKIFTRGRYDQKISLTFSGWNDKQNRPVCLMGIDGLFDFDIHSGCTYGATIHFDSRESKEEFVDAINTGYIPNFWARVR